MNRSAESIARSAAERVAEQVPRCRHPHPDFPTMAAHVRADFPAVPPSEFARELRLAADALGLLHVGEEALEVAEIIVRNRLLLRTGRIATAARLDPERRRRRSA